MSHPPPIKALWTPGAVLRALRAHYGSTDAAKLAVNAECRIGRERWIVAAYRLVARLNLKVEE